MKNYLHDLIVASLRSISRFIKTVGDWDLSPWTNIMPSRRPRYHMNALAKAEEDEMKASVFAYLSNNRGGQKIKNAAYLDGLYGDVVLKPLPFPGHNDWAEWTKIEDILPYFVNMALIAKADPEIDPAFRNIIIGSNDVLAIQKSLEPVGNIFIVESPSDVRCWDRFNPLKHNVIIVGPLSVSSMKFSKTLSTWINVTLHAHFTVNRKYESTEVNL